MTIEELSAAMEKLSARVGALEKATHYSLPKSGNKNIGAERADKLSQLGVAAEKVLAIISDYHNGIAPITTLCKRYGIEYARFLRFCDRASYLDEKDYVELRHPDELEFATGIDRLYAGVFGVSVDEAIGLQPPDYEEAIEIALSHLTDRERLVVEDRMDGQTLQEIAENIGITRERVRQIQVQAYRKLRREPIRNMLLYGPSAQEEAQRMIEAAQKSAAEEVASKLASRAEVTAKPIESLKLTARAYNCLKRFTDIITIGQLIAYSRADLLAIRSMGRKSVAEIADKLKLVGLTLKGDEI